MLGVLSKQCNTNGSHLQKWANLHPLVLNIGLIYNETLDSYRQYPMIRPDNKHIGLEELGLVELGLVELGLVELGLVGLGLVELGLVVLDSALGRPDMDRDYLDNRLHLYRG